MADPEQVNADQLAFWNEWIGDISCVFGEARLRAILSNRETTPKKAGVEFRFHLHTYALIKSLHLSKFFLACLPGRSGALC
jgi:hypothetical protein